MLTIARKRCHTAIGMKGKKKEGGEKKWNENIWIGWWENTAKS